MIGRTPNPKEPGQVVFVPMRFDPDANQWIPIRPGRDPSCAYSIDAARACFEHMLPLWRAVEQRASVVRALCQNPAFEFDGNGVDSDMVLREANALMHMVDTLGVNLERLLQQPKPDDSVCIGGVAMTGAELAALTSQQDTE